jgi:hypothetical protein
VDKVCVAQEAKVQAALPGEGAGTSFTSASNLSCVEESSTTEEWPSKENRLEDPGVFASASLLALAS